ncbi:MAG: hypothetical protein A2V70_10355 [Planctomycetes bacterium RBG_13_63_9]|nr:MAG: hypothetical protein A2V70_10355 [Planctomycetes bacterium RBG_13_63_9]
MLNELYDTVEAILEGLDAGGEQSRAFAEEIKMLKDILGYPEPAVDAYANKAELERELSAAIETFGGWLPELQRRVACCQRNWDRVRSDATKLKEPELFDGYSEAEDAARKEYMLALYYRDRTATILGNAQSVLGGHEKRRPRAESRAGRVHPNRADLAP